MNDKISNCTIIDDDVNESCNNYNEISDHNNDNNLSNKEIESNEISNNNDDDNNNNEEIEKKYNRDYENEENSIFQVIEPTTIFVGDLAYFTNENDLIQLFLPFNPLNVKIMRNPMTQKSMQYAFISFASIDDAENAIFSLNGKRFKGRNLRINFAAYKSDLVAGISGIGQQLIPYRHTKPVFTNANSVHVKFVSTVKNKKKHLVITEELLSMIFSIFGNVYDCSIKESAFDHKNNCQYGYGFVHFHDIGPAINAASVYANAYLEHLGVSVKVTLSKNLLTSMATTLPYVYTPSPYEASQPYETLVPPNYFNIGDFGALPTCAYQPINPCWNEVHACEVIDISEVIHVPLQPMPIPITSKENACNGNGPGNYIDENIPIGYEYFGPLPLQTNDHGFKKRNSNRKTNERKVSQLNFSGSGSYRIR